MRALRARESSAINISLFLKYLSVDLFFKYSSKLTPLNALHQGGAGSEVWNRVYMIAPVKKFGRVRLSTIFFQNKYGGEWGK